MKDGEEKNLRIFASVICFPFFFLLPFLLFESFKNSGIGDHSELKSFETLLRSWDFDVEAKISGFIPISSQNGVIKFRGHCFLRKREEQEVKISS